MSVRHALQELKDSLKRSERMPIAFIGHGSPMNAVEDSPFTQSWRDLGQILPKPQVVLVISAHWMTRGTTLVDASAMPKTIHDFYGFPEKLYAEQYPAPGDPELARNVAALLASHQAQETTEWGLDHGAWTVLKFLFPEADIPVFQLSIDLRQDLHWHLGLGKELADLRNQGVLILGSGNVVHNLRGLRFDGRSHDWTEEFDARFAEKLNDRDFNALADTKGWGNLLHMAHPTLDHYIPTMTIAGAAHEQDELFFTTDGFDLGALSMRSFVFHGS